MSRILVAEDDRKQADLIRMYLEREGHSVMVVHDGRTALERIRSTTPDLVVLDIMMPRMDGLDVARIVRDEQRIPIVIVTARSTEDDILLGLDLGADDYVTKPFSPRELAARVRAVLRRDGQAATHEDSIVHGDLEIDMKRHEVRVRGRVVDCTPREFAILEALIREPGRAFTRYQLLEKAFGFDYFGLERTVDAHVMKLRKKVETDPARPTLIQTVRGVGYRMGDA